MTGVRFGTSGRNILRNPGVFNTDLDVTRYFQTQGEAQTAVPGPILQRRELVALRRGKHQRDIRNLHADHQRFG